MTSKERLLTAFKNKEPDTVPIAPDIDLIGMRWWAEKTKQPWWQVYLYNDPPLADVYIEANKKLGCDIWDYFCTLKFESSVEQKKKIIEKTEDKVTVEYTTKTPYGKLREVIVYPGDNPPWKKERLIKTIEKDWPKLRWVMEQKKHLPEFESKDNIGNNGVIEIYCGGFPDFWGGAKGSENMLIDFIDSVQAIDKIFKFYYQYVMEVTKVALQTDIDAILMGGSSCSMSLISPHLYRKYCLPLVKEQARVCKEAKIISHAHTCGRSRKVVRINYEETDLNVMEPLEGPPMGDIDLREVKQKFGDRLCLKGNISTITLLGGSPKDVEREVKKAIDEAAEGGGFVLSTGDSPGRDTPDENIYEMVETGKKYGKY